MWAGRWTGLIPSTEQLRLLDKAWIEVKENNNIYNNYIIIY